MQFVLDIRILKRAIEVILLRCGAIAANLILARMLTPAAWGVFIAILSVNQALFRLTNINAGVSMDRGHAPPAVGRFLYSGILALCAVGLSVALSGPISDFFGAPDMQPWLIAAGIGAAAQCVAGYGPATLPGAGNFPRVLTLNPAASAAYLVLLLGAWVAGFHQVWAVVAVFVIVQLGSALWSVTRGLRLGMHFGVAQYLTDLLPSLALMILMGTLSREAGVGSLAGLTVALSLAQLVPLAVTGASRAFIEEKNDGVCASELGRYLKSTAAAAIVTMLAVAALAPGVTPILFGTTYAPAVDSVFIALMVAGIQSVKQALLDGQVSQHRGSLALVNAVIAAALAVPLGFRLIPDYGLGGFLIAQGLSEAAATAVVLVTQVWRLRRDMPFLDTVIAYGVLALALVATAAGHWTAESDIHLSVFTLLLDAALFVSAYGLIGRETRERAISAFCELLPLGKASPGRSK